MTLYSYVQTVLRHGVSLSMWGVRAADNLYIISITFCVILLINEQSLVTSRKIFFSFLKILSIKGLKIFLRLIFFVFLEYPTVFKT